MRKLSKFYRLPTLLAVAMFLAVGLVGIDSGTPANAVVDPNTHGFGFYEGATGGCQALAHHSTNYAGYAVAYTDTGTAIPGTSHKSCWRSDAIVYYPYLQYVWSYWGYFDSPVAVSAFQAQLVGSDHDLCIGNGDCYSDPGGTNVYTLP